MQTHAFRALAALVAGLPLAAAAADFAPPRGCTTFLTVQSRGCSVSLLWSCDVAPAGDFWEATFSDQGLESIVSYSAAYQWIDALYMWDSSREEFAPPAADPIDAGELVRAGIDTYDFTMRRTEPDRSYDVRVVGVDQLTGATAEIDGFVLDEVQTRLEIIAEDGTVEYRSAGQQFYSRELGHFFLGKDQVFADDGSVTDYDDTPVDIIRPGEPGFAVTAPLYDCNLQDARYVPGAGGGQ